MTAVSGPGGATPLPRPPPPPLPPVMPHPTPRPPLPLLAARPPSASPASLFPTLADVPASGSSTTTTTPTSSSPSSPTTASSATLMLLPLPPHPQALARRPLPPPSSLRPHRRWSVVPMNSFSPLLRLVALAFSLLPRRPPVLPPASSLVTPPLLQSLLQLISTRFLLTSFLLLVLAIRGSFPDRFPLLATFVLLLPLRPTLIRYLLPWQTASLPSTFYVLLLTRIISPSVVLTPNHRSVLLSARSVCHLPLRPA